MAEGKGPEGKRDGKWQMGRWQTEAGSGGRGRLGVADGVEGASARIGRDDR